MAKFGPSNKSGYDPFKDIEHSISELSASTVVDEVDLRADPPRAPKRIPPAPEKPAVREVPVEVEVGPNRPTRAVEDAKRPAAEHKSTSEPGSSATAFEITKRMKTSRSDASQFDAAAMKLGATLGVSVDFSKLTRALWEVYLRHQEDVLKNVPEGQLWERPPNSDTTALTELDDRIADLINDGLMIACRRPKNTK
jgi:hypothetical protein